MTEILSHEPHAQSMTHTRNRREPRMRSRAEVETMLREIAFVLHLTARVRDEIDDNVGAQEFVHA